MDDSFKITSGVSCIDIVNLLFGISTNKLNNFVSNKNWGTFKSYDYKDVYNHIELYMSTIGNNNSKKSLKTLIEK